MDKVWHFLAGAAVTTAALALGLDVSSSALIGVLIGVGKEVYDELTGSGRSEALDSAATASGALLAAGIAAF